MGSTLICVNWRKYNRQMIIYLLMILFASTSIRTHVGFMAEGRAISNQIQASQKGMKEQGLVKTEKSQNQIIGSRPPKCERRCRSCEKCEAAQIPVEPKRVESLRSRSSAAIRGSSAVVYSRGDDVTNYKPMSWKCKCGNKFFDP